MYTKMVGILLSGHPQKGPPIHGNSQMKLSKKNRYPFFGVLVTRIIVYIAVYIGVPDAWKLPNQRAQVLLLGNLRGTLGGPMEGGLREAYRAYRECLQSPSLWVPLYGPWSKAPFIQPSGPLIRTLYDPSEYPPLLKEPKPLTISSHIVLRSSKPALYQPQTLLWGPL